jgi:radical SAM-linked protein
MRVRYAKEGNGVALSHLETMTAMLRALRRADLPIPYSQGFNPKPLVAFGPACPVGIESDAEHLDLDLTIDEAAPIGAEEVAERLRIQLPTGLRLLDVRALPAGAPSLGSAIRALQHSALLPESAPPAEERVAAFWASAEASVVREREGKPPQRINLKETVLALEAEGPRRVRFTVRAGEGGATARPSELLCYLFGEASTQPGLASIRREALLLADGANG